MTLLTSVRFESIKNGNSPNLTVTWINDHNMLYKLLSTVPLSNSEVSLFLSLYFSVLKFGKLSLSLSLSQSVSLSLYFAVLIYGGHRSEHRYWSVCTCTHFIKSRRHPPRALLLKQWFLLSQELQLGIVSSQGLVQNVILFTFFFLILALSISLSLFFFFLGFWVA